MYSDKDACELSLSITCNPMRRDSTRNGVRVQAERMAGTDEQTRQAIAAVAGSWFVIQEHRGGGGTVPGRHGGKRNAASAQRGCRMSAIKSGSNAAGSRVAKRWHVQAFKNRPPPAKVRKDYGGGASQFDAIAVEVLAVLGMRPSELMKARTNALVTKVDVFGGRACSYGLLTGRTRRQSGRFR